MLSIVAVVFFNSCKKNEIGEEMSNSTSLIGTWELRQAQFSMMPMQNYFEGNGNILKFTGSTYERFTNGILVKSGNYFIMNDSTVEAEVGLVIPEGQFINRVVFDSISSPRKTFMEISNSKLTLLSGYFPLDGGSKELYERLTNHR